MRYLVSSLIIVLIILGIRIRISLLKKQKHVLEEMVSKRTDELSELNTLMEEKQEEITQQNEALLEHRTNLERLVEERTSELKTAKNKAEESDKLKSAFLANMSHEIRTPMNSIIGFSEILGDKDLEDHVREKYMKTITHSGETLTTLINDIIDISMIEANQLALHMDSFSVDDILEELRNDLLIQGIGLSPKYLLLCNREGYSISLHTPQF